MKTTSHFVVIYEWEEDFPYSGTATHRDIYGIYATIEEAINRILELTYLKHRKCDYEIEEWRGHNKIKCGSIYDCGYEYPV